MLLSLADAGNRHITVHGGQNLTHFMASTRHFVFKMSSMVRTHEFKDNSGPFQDENLSVLPVPIHPIDPSLASEDTTTVAVKKVAVDSGNGKILPIAISIPKNAPRASFNRPSPSRNGQQTPSRSRSAPTVHAGQKRKAGDEDADSTSVQDESMAYKREIIRQMFNSGESLSIRIGKGDAFHERKDGSRFDRQNGQNNNLEVPNIALGKKDHTKLVRLPMARPSKTATCFICQGPPVRGKFDTDKATALGVPTREFGTLHQGDSFLNDKGERIHPHQCMGPDRPGSVFFIIDCPSADYIGTLVNNARFVPHYASLTNNPVSVIVHMLGDDVLDNAAYRSWMNKFGETTQHIIISGKHCAKPIIFRGSATSQHRLSLLDPEVFRIPFYDNESISLNHEGLPPRTMAANNLLIYQMEPQGKVDVSEQKTPWDHMDPNGKVLATLDKPRLREYQTEAKRLREEMLASAAEAENTGQPGDDVLVCTLGTGAALPSRYRNVSSTLVYTPSHGSILFDAGEGTYGQLYRRFKGADGPSLEDVLTNLKFLFISHMHADHHLGAFKVLLERKKLFDKAGKTAPTICIVGPPQYRIWLDEFDDCEPLGLAGDQVTFLPCHDLLAKNSTSSTVLDRLKDDLGLNAIETVQVHHSHYSYAVSLAHQSGYKIVYSGDCRPNLDLMTVGGDADVLIHEATFEDDPTGSREAQDKRHSTTQEAVIVGGRMRAKWIFLTHFSQRYPKMPSLNFSSWPAADQEQRKSSVGVAFDMMAIKIGQMRRMAKYFGPLEKLYPAAQEESPDLEEGELERAADLSGGGGGEGRKDGGSRRGGRGRGRGRGRGHRGGHGGHRGRRDNA
ncbi:hypothetical protein SpCBS45565_g07801 [Spizellomyces sp. 'palustris']|nr:hypothetical protein SpCBS45565_g07801 [Spizellomyces sp. 'palustris']